MTMYTWVMIETYSMCKEKEEEGLLALKFVWMQQFKELKNIQKRVNKDWLWKPTTVITTELT